MDDNLFFVREAQPVFADKGDSEGLTVHGFFSTWPVHKLILGLWGPENKLSYSVIKYLLLSFLANQPIMFAIFQTTQLTF